MADFTLLLCISAPCEFLLAEVFKGYLLGGIAVGCWRWERERETRKQNKRTPCLGYKSGCMRHLFSSLT